jgi:molybdopterin synthase catalytic subunit
MDKARLELREGIIYSIISVNVRGREVNGMGQGAIAGFVGTVRGRSSGTKVVKNPTFGPALRRLRDEIDGIAGSSV